MFRQQLLPLFRRGQNADAQWFTQKQQIAGLGCVIALEMVQIHQTVDGQPENRLGRVYAVATGQGDPGILAGLASAIYHGGGDFGTELVDGPA